MATITRHECSSTGKVTYASHMANSNRHIADFFAVICVPVALGITFTASSTMYQMVASAVACTCLINLAVSMATVSRETLVVLPDMGVLMESFSTCGMRLDQRFVELQLISSVFIHEALTAHEIRSGLNSRVG